MDFGIRKFKNEDKTAIVEMMEEFYSSPVVMTNGSIEIFEKDFDTCLNNPTFLEGFIFYNKDNILGYAMIAKSFSTEFARNVIYLEDLYLKAEFRSKGIIPKFIEYIKYNYPNTLLKLEVEKENLHACHCYKKCGFKELDYIEMYYLN